MRETPEELKELQALLDDAFDWDDDAVHYRPYPHWTTVYAPDVGKLTAASRSWSAARAASRPATC